MRPSDLRFRVSITLATLLAAVTGFYRIGIKGLSLDEAVGVDRLSVGPFPELIQRLQDEEITLALYHVLLYGWKQVASSEAALRSLSVIFFVLTIPVTYALGQRLLTRGEALLGAFLVAIHGFAIEWAQELRGYSLLMLLSAVCFLLFLNVIAGRPMAGFWFGLAWTMTLLTHLFAWILLLGLLVSLLLNLSSRGQWLPQLVRSAPFILASSAYVGWAVLRNMAGGAGLGWVPPLSIARIKGLLVQLAGGEILSGVIIVPIVAIAVGYLVVRGLRTRQWEPGLLMIAVWTSIPVAATILFSIVGRPILVSRYLIGLVPLVALILARAVTFPRVRWVQVVVGMAVVFGLAYGALGWYTAGPRGDFRAAAEIVATQATDDELVFLIPDYLHWPFNYYYEQSMPAISLSVVGVPESLTAFTDTVDGSHERALSGFWVVIRTGDLGEQSTEPGAGRGLRLTERYSLDGLLLLHYSVVSDPTD